MGIDDLMARAGTARRLGDAQGAETLLLEALRQGGERADILNALGMATLNSAPGRAAAWLERAALADPGAIALWLNLGDARRQEGDLDRALAAFQRALTIDPYALPALAAKAQLLEQMGRLKNSAAVYAAILSAYGGHATPPPQLEGLLDHARAVVALAQAQRVEQLADPLARARADHPDADMTRANAFVDGIAGKRRIYYPAPTGSHFPFLPAQEFFARSQFPWFAQLEQATADIRSEMLNIRNAADGSIDPYVQFAPGVPVNQWAALDHSTDWGAIFLWKDGVAQDHNLARCPRTAQVLAQMPLLDIPGKSPTVMFSLLEPGAHIPPHTGTTNVRATVHLPLFVPEGCRFRVGGETRTWCEGEAWAFDDTIEHEAWNDSDQWRGILILDVWNPHLTEAERAIVRATGG